MVDVTYSIVYDNYHDGTSKNTGHYYCDILDLNTGICWRCEDDTIKQFRGMLETFYSMASYPISGDIFFKVMKGSDTIVSMLY